MELRLCVLLLAVACGIAANINSNGLNPKVSPWNTLILNLLDDSRYQPYVRPYTANGKPLNVSHSVQVLRVDSLVNHVLTLNTWIDMKWKDERLAWNPDYYDGVSEVKLPIQTIWHPDVVLYNSVDEWQPSFGIYSNAIVNHDGNVTFTLPKNIRSICGYETKTMKRHHNVTCQLEFGPWVTYEGGVVDIHTIGEGIIKTGYFVPSDIWKVTNMSAVRNVVKYTCCPEVYVSLTYSITLKYTGN